VRRNSLKCPARSEPRVGEPHAVDKRRVVTVHLLQKGNKVSSAACHKQHTSHCLLSVNLMASQYEQRKEHTKLNTVLVEVRHFDGC
jgi:hypothetical protein